MKTINLQRNYSRISILFGGAMMALLVFSLFGIQSAYAAITSQLDFGDRGSEVTELQTYLATNSSIYPEGLVTGYFGQLTKAAVERFQTAQGIISQGTPATTGYGRVGPVTMARINALLGGASTGFDKNAPFIQSPSITTTNSSVTANWNTSENAAAIFYYSSSPISMVEANANAGVTIHATAFLANSDLRTSHSATVTGLQSNTTYHYVLYVRDGSGNESITWPTTFRTN